MAFKDMAEEERISFQEELDRLFMDAVNAADRKYVGRGQYETIIDSPDIRALSMAQYGVTADDIARVNAYNNEMPLFLLNSIGRAVNEKVICQDSEYGDTEKYKVLFSDLTDEDSATPYVIYSANTGVSSESFKNANTDLELGIVVPKKKKGEKRARAIHVAVDAMRIRGVPDGYSRKDSPVVNKAVFDSKGGKTATLDYVNWYRAPFDNSIVEELFDCE